MHTNTLKPVAPVESLKPVEPIDFQAEIQRYLSELKQPHAEWIHPSVFELAELFDNPLDKDLLHVAHILNVTLLTFGLISVLFTVVSIIQGSITFSAVINALLVYSLIRMLSYRLKYKFFYQVDQLSIKLKQSSFWDKGCYAKQYQQYLELLDNRYNIFIHRRPQEQLGIHNEESHQQFLHAEKQLRKIVHLPAVYGLMIELQSNSYAHLWLSIAYVLMLLRISLEAASILPPLYEFVDAVLLCLIASFLICALICGFKDWFCLDLEYRNIAADLINNKTK